MADQDVQSVEHNVGIDGNSNEDMDVEAIQDQNTSDALDVQNNDLVAQSSDNPRVCSNGAHHGVRGYSSSSGSVGGTPGDSIDCSDFLKDIEKLMNEDVEKTGLNKIFVFNTSLLNSIPFLNQVVKFLDYKSKLAFRQVSKLCNAQIINHPSFIKKTGITMGKKWYRDSIGMNNMVISMKFGDLKLERFTYHGKSVLLKHYCENIRSTLNKLTITHCSLEYNGLSYFLRTLTCLENLVLSDVRLQAPRSAPKPDDEKPFNCVKPLKSLTLEKIYLLNSWATSLFVRRSGQLETLILKDLFIKDEKLVKLIAEERVQIRQEHEKVKRDRNRNRNYNPQEGPKKIPRETKDPEKTNEGTIAFYKRLPHLLHANKDSLKKLVLEESVDTGLEIVYRFFKAVADQNIELKLNEFWLTYLPLKCLAAHVIKFSADCCKDLEVFKLKIVGSCDNALFADILGTDLKKSVRKLVLDFDSSLFIGGGESLNLDGLRGFEKLELFKLIDSKKISKPDSVAYNKVYRRAFPKIQVPAPARPNRPRRQNRAQNNEPQPPPPAQNEQPEGNEQTLALNELQAMDQKFETKCPFNFTQYLRPEIKELCLNNFITSQGDSIINVFAQVDGRHVLENLTKLELRRSNKMFLKSSPVLMECIATLTKLRSLTLAKMHLNDFDLTGMDLKHCKRLRSTMTHQSILLFTPGPENDDNQEAKAEFMRYMNGEQFKKIFANLKDLKYLDISGNLKITDLALIEMAKIPQLKSLNVADNNKITDSGLHYISQNLPNLEEINLRNLRRTSEYGMNKLLFGCKKLQSIYTTSIMKNQTKKDILEYEISKDYDQVLKTPWGENKIKLSDETEEIDSDLGDDDADGNENDE